MRVIYYLVGILALILSAMGEGEEAITPNSDGEVQGSSEPVAAQETGAQETASQDTAVSPSPTEVNDGEAQTGTSEPATSKAETMSESAAVNEIADGEVQEEKATTEPEEAETETISASSSSSSVVNSGGVSSGSATAQVAGMPPSVLESNGEKMIDSTKAGCPGIKCLAPREDQKVEGCTQVYPDGATGLEACCPVWSCAKQNGQTYSNGSVSGSSGVFNNGPNSNQTLPPNVPSSLPPGANVKYESQQQTFTEHKPGVKSRGRSNSYSYSSSSSYTTTTTSNGAPSPPAPGSQQMPMPKGG